MRRIYGTGDFEHVSYQILEEPGKRILNVDAVEKTWGPNYLRLGLGLSSDLRGDAYFNLLGSYRMRWLNSLGARMAQRPADRSHESRLHRVLPALGAEPDAVRRAELRTAAPARRRLRTARSASRASTSPTGLLRFEAGAQFTRYGEMRVGLTRSDVKTTLDTGSTALVVANSREQYTLLTVRGLADQMDNVNFPRNGYAGSFELVSAREALGSDVNFARGQINGQTFASWGRNTVSAGVKFGGRLGNDPVPPVGLFSWGGLLQQSGYPTGALVGDNNIRFGRAP